MSDYRDGTYPQLASSLVPDRSKPWTGHDGQLQPIPCRTLGMASCTSSDELYAMDNILTSEVG